MKIANLDPTYSPSLGGSTAVTSSATASDAVADHVADSSGAHTAPAISVIDAGGWFGGATDPGDLTLLYPELYGAVDLETALAQLAALATADSAILGDLCLLSPEDDGIGAAGGGGGGIEVKEADGTPDVTGVTQIIVSNGSLTNNGGGSVTIAGSALTVEEVDGSPTDSAVTKIIFPNGTLAIASHVVTYTPPAEGVKYKPDNETPSTPPAFAAEFNSATDSCVFDTAPTIDDVTSFPGYRYVRRSTSTENWLSRAWAPAGDLTMAAKLSITESELTGSGIDVMFGVANGSSPSATDGVFTTVFSNYGGSAIGWQGYIRSASSWGAVGTTQAFLDSAISGFLYLALTRSADTWTFYLSRDGIGWITFPTTASKAFSPSHAVLRLADGPGIVTLDWIRGWTSVLSPIKTG